jgi:hypothetical protein
VQAVVGQIPIVVETQLHALRHVQRQRVRCGNTVNVPSNIRKRVAPVEQSQICPGIGEVATDPCGKPVDRDIRGGGGRGAAESQGPGARHVRQFIHRIHAKTLHQRAVGPQAQISSRVKRPGQLFIQSRDAVAFRYVP